MPADATPQSPFRPALFELLRELASNNRRDWFEANKARYEAAVKHPALTFISDFGPLLRDVSPHFDAIPKAVGGSLFRIHRDTRFSPDKTPYKTHVGIQFRHKRGGDVHAPGFYLHLEPGRVFAGAGIWHPDADSLRAIRDAITAQPESWSRAVSRTVGSAVLALGGEALSRPPRGYPADHPHLEDLKRKDFFAFAELTESDALAADFPSRYAGLCQAAAPLMSFLCAAVGVPF